MARECNIKGCPIIFMAESKKCFLFYLYGVRKSAIVIDNMVSGTQLVIITTIFGVADDQKNRYGTKR